MAGKDSDLNYHPQESELGREHVEGQVIPHARLLGEIFNQKQIPVPPNREREIINAVEKALSSLTGREQVVMRLVFGLDGEPLSMAEAGRKIGEGYNPIGRERIRQIKAKALRKFHHPSRSKELRGNLIVPEESLAHRVFGAVLRKDTPVMNTENLSLSPPTIDELSQKGLHIHGEGMMGWRARGEILTHDFSEVGLSNESFTELSQELRRLAKEAQEEVAQKPVEVITVVKPKEEEKVEPVVNNLLPEVDLTEEELNALRKIHVRDEKLGLSVRVFNSLWRSGIYNLGQVFELEKRQLWEIRNLGSVGIKEFGEKLEQFLNLPEEKIAKGKIAGLFDLNVVAKSSKPETVSTQTPDARDMYENHSMQAIRLMVRSALHEGLYFSEDIQDWIVKSGENVGFNPRGEITRALIEYVLSHPQQKEK